MISINNNYFYIKFPMLSNPCKKANHESIDVKYVFTFPNCSIGRLLCY